MSTPRLAVLLGSTRPGRAGAAVAQWVMERAAGRDGAAYELVDLADFDLDLLNEPTVPGAAKRQYENAKTRRWSEVVDGFDGFVFVTPEYNHGVPAALKNAVDVLYPEWNHKAVSFVSYGADAGVRAVEQWRVIAANVHLHATRAQVSMSTFFDWEDKAFTPIERRAQELDGLLDQLEALASAVRVLRD